MPLSLQKLLLTVLSGGSGLQYYVATTGNDSTGDGSVNNPWLTISKALATVAIDKPATINVAAGTYAENTVSSGYLNLTRVFTQWIRIRGLGAVTITNASGTTYCVRYNGGTKVAFHDVTIEPSTAITNATVEFTSATAHEAEFNSCTVNNVVFSFRVSSLANVTITFNSCTMQKKTGAAGTVFLGFVALMNTTGSLNVVFNNCTVIAQSNSVTAGAVDIGRVPSTSPVVNATINGGTFSNTGGYGVQISGGTLNISGATITTTTSGLPALVFGDDAVSTVVTNGSATGCILTSNNSHSLLLGGGATNVVCSDLTINAGDYSLVFKECNGCTVTNSTIHGGTLATVYFKAAVNSGVTFCDIDSHLQQAVLVGLNSVSGNKSSGVVFTDNNIICTGSADVFDWNGDSEDAGGGVCDRNTYDISGTSGNLGDVRAATNILNLASLQAAWSGYGAGTNDANSTVID